MKPLLWSGIMPGLLLLLLMGCAGTGPATHEIDYVDISEEISLGKEISKVCNEHLALFQNKEVSNYLTRLAFDLGDQSEWLGNTYQVNIVDSSNYNHFSLPGGHIYLYRGLFDSTTTLEETALVLAHEIAHIADRHGIERISQEFTFAFAAQSVFGYNPEITQQIIADLYAEHSILNYEQGRERTADQKAVEYSVLAEYNPGGMLQYLEKVSVAETDSTELIAVLENTHENAARRIRTVRNAIEAFKQNSDLPQNRQDPAFDEILGLLIKK